MINLISDLHLEFGNLSVPEGNGVLILAGDIHVGNKASDWIDKCLKNFDLVIYVMGNHEFYFNNMNAIIHWWKEAAKYRDNFVVLDNDSIIHEGVRYLGTTLWTSALLYGLEDYHVIQYHNGTITPYDTQILHHQAVQWLEQQLKTPFDGETVVITHHAPIPECVQPWYIGDHINPCFHANLNSLIEDNDIAFWLHGHMHDSIFMEYHDTIIVCNPRGYVGYEVNKNFENPLVLKL